MSEQNLNAGCNGDCDSCGSDCETKGAGTTITLQMDDGREVECMILTIFEADTREYIVLLPLDENGMAESEEVYIYRYGHSAEGHPFLENIMDEEEYEKVSEAFETYLGQIQIDQELSGIVDNENSAN